MQKKPLEMREREIERLVLVTHEIDQKLGLLLENLNFIDDVDVFRKTLKIVYAAFAFSGRFSPVGPKKELILEYRENQSRIVILPDTQVDLLESWPCTLF